MDSPIQRYWRWFLAIVLTATAAVLGYLGFAQYFAQEGVRKSFWDLAYLTLQLFVLESGAVGGSPPLELQIARLLAPLLPAWALVKTLTVIFRDQLKLLRLRFTSGHYVICGLGDKGLKLVRDLREDGERVVVIESDERNPYLGICQSLGARLLLGNAVDKDLLRRARVHRAAIVVAISGDDGVNVETAVLTSHLIRESGPPPDAPVRCFVHLVDTRLCSLFKNHRIFTDEQDAFEARVFNVNEHNARRLLEDHPLDAGGGDRPDAPVPNLIVVGFDQMGETLALQAVRASVGPAGVRARLTIVDRAAREREYVFRNRYPRFAEIGVVEFVEGDARSPEMLDRITALVDDPALATGVAVTVDGDSRSLLCALTIRSRLGDRRTPIFVRMAGEAGLATLLRRDEEASDWVANIHPFGSDSLLDASHAVQERKLDATATALHDAVLAAFAEEPAPGAHLPLAPWPQLEQRHRETLRQLASYLPALWRRLGREIAATGHPPPPVTLSEEETRLAARMLHERWRVEMILANWQAGDHAPDRLSHPEIVEWSRVSPEWRRVCLAWARALPAVAAAMGPAAGAR